MPARKHVPLVQYFHMEFILLHRLILSNILHLQFSSDVHYPFPRTPNVCCVYGKFITFSWLFRHEPKCTKAMNGNTCNTSAEKAISLVCCHFQILDQIKIQTLMCWCNWFYWSWCLKVPTNKHFRQGLSQRPIHPSFGQAVSILDGWKILKLSLWQVLQSSSALTTPNTANISTYFVKKNSIYKVE